MSARGRRLVWLACLGGAIALSSMLVFVGLTTSQASAQARTARTGVTPDEALAEPRPLLYRTVAVRGRIARIYNSRYLALASRSVRQGLLVVLDGHVLKAEGSLYVGQEVVVTGEVRLLNSAESRALASAVGLGLPLDNRPFGYSNHPYIMAQEVRPWPGD